MEKLRTEFGLMTDYEKDVWESKRKKALRKLWVCADCGRRLPPSGMVWSFRLRNYIKANMFVDNAKSGVRCDSCADIAEHGGC